MKQTLKRSFIALLLLAVLAVLTWVLLPTSVPERSINAVPFRMRPLTREERVFDEEYANRFDPAPVVPNAGAGSVLIRIRLLAYEHSTEPEGARIRVGTKSEGRWVLCAEARLSQFEFKAIPGATYLIEGRATGRIPECLEFVASQGREFELRLKTWGALYVDCQWDDGGAVESAFLRVIGMGKIVERELRPSDNGRFGFLRLPPGDYLVEASVLKRAASNLMTIEKVSVQAGQATEGVIFRFKRPGFVSGRVIRSDTREPLSQAPVEIVDNFSGGTINRTVTDSLGNFQAETGYPQGVNVEVLAQRFGFKSARKIIAAHARDASVELALEPEPNLLTVRVMDQSGAPVTDAAVSIQDLYSDGNFGSGSASGRTDSKGQWTCEPCPDGYLVVRATAPGFAHAEMRTSLGGIRDARLEFRLTRSAAFRIALRGPGGIALAPGLEVFWCLVPQWASFDPLQDYPMACSSLDAEGGFALPEVAVGEYDLFFCGGDLKPRCVRVLISDASKSLVLQMETSAPVEFKLGPDLQARLAVSVPLVLAKDEKGRELEGLNSGLLITSALPPLVALRLKTAHELRLLEGFGGKAGILALRAGSTSARVGSSQGFCCITRLHEVVNLKLSDGVLEADAANSSRLEGRVKQPENAPCVRVAVAPISDVPAFASAWACWALVKNGNYLFMDLVPGKYAIVVLPGAPDGVQVSASAPLAKVRSIELLPGQHVVLDLD